MVIKILFIRLEIYNGFSCIVMVIYYYRFAKPIFFFDVLSNPGIVNSSTSPSGGIVILRLQKNREKRKTEYY